ncbi:MAG: hypothetical protein GY772_22825 [bacterium]|nr:hypothetical protein [bacterium]
MQSAIQAGFSDDALVFLRRELDAKRLARDAGKPLGARLDAAEARRTRARAALQQATQGVERAKAYLLQAEEKRTEILEELAAADEGVAQLRAQAADTGFVVGPAKLGTRQLLAAIQGKLLAIQGVEPTHIKQELGTFLQEVQQEQDRLTACDEAEDDSSDDEAGDDEEVDEGDPCPAKAAASPPAAVAGEAAAADMELDDGEQRKRKSQQKLQEAVRGFLSASEAAEGEVQQAIQTIADEELKRRRTLSPEKDETRTSA